MSLWSCFWLLRWLEVSVDTLAKSSKLSLASFSFMTLNDLWSKYLWLVVSICSVTLHTALKVFIHKIKIQRRFIVHPVNTLHLHSYPRSSFTASVNCIAIDVCLRVIFHSCATYLHGWFISRDPIIVILFMLRVVSPI